MLDRLDLPLSADIGSHRLREPVEHAGEARSATTSAEDQVGGDELPGGVVEFVGESAKSLFGGPARPEPSDQSSHLGRDRGGCGSQRRDQRLLKADTDGEDAGRASGSIPPSLRDARSATVPGPDDNSSGKADEAIGTTKSAIAQPVTITATSPREDPAARVCWVDGGWASGGACVVVAPTGFRGSETDCERRSAHRR